MRLLRRPFFWIVLGAVLIGAALIPLNRAVTTWISGDKFRELLDKETSKGMKFDGHYAPLRRDGWLGMQTDSFKGVKGRKTIVSLEAHHVTGWFNPLGVALRHWELHALHIGSGTVWLQKTEATPGEPKGQKPIPWWALFWPYRVELEDVKCDDADVLFKLQDKESGIYHTLLEITPNDRDFEYDAKGGLFRTPMTPPLHIEHIHLLVRKPRLTCEIFTLCEDPAHPEQQLAITGKAGLQDDRSIEASAVMKSLPVAAFLPEKLRANVRGEANGRVDYHSTGTGLETAEAHGSVEIADAVLHDLQLVQEYVKITASPDPGDLHFQTCRTDIRYAKGAITLENLAAECPGVLKLDGTVTIAKDGTLSGKLHVGLTAAYLKWLPTAQSAIFTATDGEFHVATVHLSGTSKKPVQDLSPRVLKELSKSPGTAIKLFFRTL